MDYASLFMFCVVFAFVGFVTTVLWGVDIYKIWSDIGSFIILVPLISLLFVRPESVNEAAETMSNAIVMFANALPGMIIGDAAGTLVAGFLGAFK